MSARAPLRILHVSQPVEAGVPNVLLSYIREQVTEGWDVHVACPVTTGYLAGEARGLGVTVHPWAARRTPGPTVPDETRRLRSIIRQVAPDVVHLHSAKAGLAGRLAMRGSIPTIFQPHAWSFEAVTGLMRTASLGWERQAARWTDLMICVSEDELRLGEASKCLAQNCAVIPNGIDTVRFSPTGDAGREAAKRSLGLPPAELAVVCLGRLARQKGQDCLLRAWHQLSMPSARLHLVGSGPDEAALRADAGSTVSFAGATNDALTWLTAADLVVVPSRWEAGIPLVAMEACSIGRSVVATRVAGTTSLPEAAWIIPIDDSAALRDAIRSRLESSRLRTEEEKQNRAFATEHFDVRRSCERVITQTLSLTGRTR